MNSTDSPFISLIIPAYNEECWLPGLLQSIEQARERFEGDPTAIEVIVVDNASTDQTADIGRQFGCTVVAQPKHSIAATRNAGAAAASGKILAFVDADSVVHRDLFNAVGATLDDHTVVGATGIRMDRDSLGIRLTFWITVLVLRLARVDTGVIFCRNEDFFRVGGYPENHRYAEDVHFLRAIKRLGRSRGQRFRRAVGVTTITSARKFDQHGDWHFFTTTARALFWILFDRRSWDRFVQSYWYRNR